MSGRFLTALPVFNEAPYVNAVLDEVARHSSNVLVVDDGSTDGTAELLEKRTDILIERHEQNRGYGAALKTAFCYAIRNGFEIVVTIDCDGQHEPQRITRFVEACEGVDIVSGSRYLETHEGDSQPPADRRWINREITAELNDSLGLDLTDAFCGFKAYRTASLKKLQLSEPGYAMPLELWVQAARAELKIVELPVPLIYLDEDRSFGGSLDDMMTRLDYYHTVLDRSMTNAQQMPAINESISLCGEGVG